MKISFNFNVFLHHHSLNFLKFFGIVSLSMEEPQNAPSSIVSSCGSSENSIDFNRRQSVNEKVEIPLINDGTIGHSISRFEKRRGLHVSLFPTRN